MRSLGCLMPLSNGLKPLSWNVLASCCLRDALIARRADREQIEEAADLEQSAKLRGDTAKDELALRIIDQLVRDQQGMKAGAADVDNVLHVDQHVARARGHHLSEPVAERLGATPVDASARLQDQHRASLNLGDFHVHPPRG